MHVWRSKEQPERVGYPSAWVVGIEHRSSGFCGKYFLPAKPSHWPITFAMYICPFGKSLASLTFEEIGQWDQICLLMGWHKLVSSHALQCISLL